LLIAAVGTPAGERFLFVRYQRRSVKKRAGIFLGLRGSVSEIVLEKNFHNQNLSVSERRV
jgi:hypothetical protein